MKFFQKYANFARQVGFEPTNNGFGDRPLNHSGTDANILYCSPEGTRTLTPLRVLDFESSASTNSATRPYLLGQLDSNQH